MARRLSKLQDIIDLRQHRLQELRQQFLQSGFVSHDTATLLQVMETTVLLCQHSYKRIQESSDLLAKCNDDRETLHQIRKAEAVLSKCHKLDRIKQ